MLLRLFSYGDVEMLCEENQINTCSPQRTKTIEGSGLLPCQYKKLRTEGQIIDCFL